MISEWILNMLKQKALKERHKVMQMEWQKEALKKFIQEQERMEQQDKKDSV